MWRLDTAHVNAPVTGRFLGPSSVELDLVYGPHGSLHVLQTYEAFVEAEVMSDSVLEAGEKIRSFTRLEFPLKINM